MANERKRKHDNVARAAQSDSLTNTLFGESNNNTSSLTSSLFGDSTFPQHDLFSSPAVFSDKKRNTIASNRQTTIARKDTPQAVSDASREDILAKRQKQASAPFINEITSLAPFPVDDQDDNESNHQQQSLQDNFKMIPPNVRVEEICDIVRMHGFAIVKNVVSKTILETISQKANEIEQQVCQRLDLKKIEWRCNTFNKTPTFSFQEVASRCKGRMDVRYGTNQEPFSNAQIIQNKSLIPIINNLLGGEATTTNDASFAPKLLYAGLIFSLPGCENQPWHQDGMPLFPEINGGSMLLLPPHAINVFLPLDGDDASLQAGPTEFIPASHVMEEDEVFQKMEQSNNEGKQSSHPGIVSPILKQGDALVYDYRVCHRGTSNLQQEKTRRILYLMYARPWFREHLNFGSERLFTKESS